MPAPIPLPVRRALVRLARQGRSAAEIARRLQLSERTVRHLVLRFRERGDDDLRPSYSTKPVNAFADAVRQEFVALRDERPTWGAEFLRQRWLAVHPGEPAPAARTVRRWTQAARRPKSVRPRASAPGRAKEVHEVWQIDAAEQMTLADGSGASWLRVADERSGAVLGTAVFPPQALVGGAAARRPSRTRKAL
jgi:Helix-turn-helix domain